MNLSIDNLTTAPILTVNQFKLNKSSGKGYLTCGINLSPASEAAEYLGVDIKTSCPMAGYCGGGCLNKTGMNQMTSHLPARVKRTVLWMRHPKVFLARVKDELTKRFRYARNKGLTPIVRPNLLSDQPKLAKELAREFSNVQFYDYTKLQNFYLHALDNYNITYSFSEKTREIDIQRAVDNDINTAVVFAVKRKEDLPKRVELFGHSLKVIDGDTHDLRFLDPNGVIVGLRWKGSYDRMYEAVEAGFALEI